MGARVGGAPGSDAADKDSEEEGDGKEEVCDGKEVGDGKKDKEEAKRKAEMAAMGSSTKVIS